MRGGEADSTAGHCGCKSFESDPGPEKGHTWDNWGCLGAECGLPGSTV